MDRKIQLAHPQQLTQNRLRQLPQAISYNTLLINELYIIHKIYQLFLIPL